MLETLLTVSSGDPGSLRTRQARALAALIVILVPVSLVTGLLMALVRGTLQQSLPLVVALVLFAVVYTLNRRGQLQTAVNLLLGGLLVLMLVFGSITGMPAAFSLMLCVLPTLAAAFGQPRAPLVWAAFGSAAIATMNMLSSGSPLPAMDLATLADGTQVALTPSLELLALLLLWIQAGAAWLLARLLARALHASESATATVLAARDELATRQADLEARNHDLDHARAELEALLDALAVPVVPVGEGIGLLPLVGPLDASRIARLEQRTLEAVAARRLRTLVIDLSGTTRIAPAAAVTLSCALRCACWASRPTWPAWVPAARWR